LRELEVKAGIDKDADNARQNSFYAAFHDSDAPLFSQQSQREFEIELEREGETIRRRIRQCYFGVPDLDLRKEMITKNRELTDNGRWCRLADRSAAQAGLKAAAATGRYWPLVAAVAAVFCVLAGGALHQVTGAIAGAMVAYYLGREFEQDVMLQRATAIKAAEETLREAEATAEKALNAPYTFTRKEMWTGEPDPGSAD
jgi:hypothetical protein